jgi:hypothetical protein
MKKPRVTAKDFPDLPKASARRVARAANAIVDLLWPLSKMQRKDVIEQVQSARSLIY